MLNDYGPALTVSFLWLLLVTTAFLMVGERRVARLLQPGRYPLLLLMLLALGARLLPYLLLPVGAAYDIESFKLVGEALLAGEDVYTSAARGRYPYLPLQMYAIGGAALLGQETVVPFIVWLKLPAVLADLAVTAVLYLAFRRSRRSVDAASTAALLYALNPLTVMVSAYHGQFDAVPVLLLLLAWYLWEFGQRAWLSAAALGTAILNKTWPAVFLPVILIRLPSHRQRIIYAATALAVPLVFTLGYVLAFGSDPTPMLRRAFTHAGVSGYWGISAALTLLSNLLLNGDAVALSSILSQGILLAAALFSLWYTRIQSSLDALLTILLTVFAVTMGMGIQWLMWPVAFAALAGEKRWLKWYSLAGALMMTVHLFTLHFPSGIAQVLPPAPTDFVLRSIGFPVWLVILFWLYARLQAAAREQRRAAIVG